MIDPYHDLPVPNIDPGHKLFSDVELKKIKDSFPNHNPDAEPDLCPLCGYIECVCKEWHDRSKPFTDAALKRLAGQLDVARQQGYYFKVYMPCGVSEHRHRWAVTSWLCRLVK
jgi:hypothetical protein